MNVFDDRFTDVRSVPPSGGALQPIMASNGGGRFQFTDNHWVVQPLSSAVAELLSLACITHMAYSIPKHGVIDYPASALREFRVYGYEWIDDLHFIRPPQEFLPLSDEQLERYLAVARERFSEAGWHGDGDIGLLWLPPFVFPLDLKIHPTGVLLWHVKQEEDGISWLLSPIDLPFEEFGHGKAG